MKQREFAEAIAMFKAACEFWPELCTNEEDGEGEQTDDQFVALKEIFLAELPPDPNEEASTAPEQQQHGEFAHPRVVAACGLVIRDFNKPGVTPAQVHAGVKLLHRICVDCKRPAMAFQASMFRTFQRALRAQRQGGMHAINAKELAQLACYIMQMFAKVSRTNPHVYIELLFFKTSREAVEIAEGYGSYESSATGKGKTKRGVWTEEQEDELERLFIEFKAKMQEEGGKIKEKELVDQIWENLIDNSSRSRAAVLNKLKEMELIEVARGSFRWSDADLDQLRELYGRFSESDDVVTEIEQRLSSKRSQAVIRKRLIELGLATKETLRSKRPPKAPKSKKAGKGRNRRNSSSSESEDDVRPRTPTEMPTAKTHNYNKQGTIKAVKAAIVNGNAGAVRWLMSALSEAAEDRTNDEDEPTPLVPLSEDDSTALEDPSFLQLLQNLGLSEPIEGQELYWRIPGELNLAQLMAHCELLAGALEGRLDALEAAPETQAQEDSPARPNRRTRLESDSDREDAGAGSSKDVTGKRKHTASTDSDSGPHIGQPSSSKPTKSKKSKPKKKKIEKSARNASNSDTDDSIDYDLLGVSKDAFKYKSSAKKKIVRPVDSSDDEAMVIDDTVTSTQVAANNALVSSDEETPKTQDRSARKRALDSSDDDEPVQSVANPGPIEISSDEERPSKPQNSKRALDSSDDDEPIQVVSNGTRNNGPVEVSSDEDKPVKAQKSKRALDSSDDDEPIQVVRNGTRNVSPVEVSSDDDRPRKTQKSIRALVSSDDDEPTHSVTNLSPTEISSDEEKSPKARNSSRRLDSSDEDEPVAVTGNNKETVTEISSDEDMPLKSNKAPVSSKDMPNKSVTNGSTRNDVGEISNCDVHQILNPSLTRKLTTFSDRSSDE
ncbi:hypothetical protein B566_EDAN016969 [Ephemera danica]|nr:hypothetical protein B566_EDAN016969 [Ephemera danica]